MLPSKKRLSRDSFGKFLASKEVNTVFNILGTLKYRKAPTGFAVVISSKQEKRAVYRNRLRRRIYSVFEQYLKRGEEETQYILYVSKQAAGLSFNEVKIALNELLKKTTK